MEKQQNMRPVCEYEASYINASEYWMAFLKAAMFIMH